MKRHVTLIAIGVLVAALTSCSQQFASVQFLDKIQAKDFFLDAQDIALAESVASGNEERMNACLKAGANVNEPGKDGMTQLFWAIAKQSKAGFQFLLSHGANVNVPTRMNNGRKISVMESVSTLKNSDYLRLALQHGGNPNYLVPLGKRTIIFSAVANDTTTNLEILIHAGADINFQDGAGETPILYASAIKKYHAAYLLLKAGANVRIQDGAGYDLPSTINLFGDRGIPIKGDEFLWYGKVVEELKARGFAIHPR